MVYICIFIYIYTRYMLDPKPDPECIPNPTRRIPRYAAQGSYACRLYSFKTITCIPYMVHIRKCREREDIWCRSFPVKGERHSVPAHFSYRSIIVCVDFTLNRPLHPASHQYTQCPS